MCVLCLVQCETVEHHVICVQCSVTVYGVLYVVCSANCDCRAACMLCALQILTLGRCVTFEQDRVRN